MSDTRPAEGTPAPPAPSDRALSPELRAVLRRWADEGGPLATRAGVVLLAAEGLRDAEISRRLGVSRQTVGSWRQRWTSAGIDGLGHRPRTGRPATVDEAEVVTRTLLAPGGSGASRAVARELGLSHATVASIRRRWRLIPDEPVAPRVPTRPPLPDADVWVMGLYVDAHRAVLLAGTRLIPSTPATAGTVIGTDVLTGLDRALDAALTSAPRRVAGAGRAAPAGDGAGAGSDSPGGAPHEAVSAAQDPGPTHGVGTDGAPDTEAAQAPAKGSGAGAGGDSPPGPRLEPPRRTAARTAHDDSTDHARETGPPPGTDRGHAADVGAKAAAGTLTAHDGGAATTPDSYNPAEPARDAGHPPGAPAARTAAGATTATDPGTAARGGAGAAVRSDPAHGADTGRSTGHPPATTPGDARPATTPDAHAGHGPPAGARRGADASGPPRGSGDATRGPADTRGGIDSAAESRRALAGYLAQASRRHPDLALHAITLWDDVPGGDLGPAGTSGAVTCHQIPARSTWRTFLRAMIALDSTSHPESSRRVYLDLAAELERYAAGRADDPYRTVRWLRENVAGHLGTGTEQATDNSGRGQTWSGVNQIDLGSFNECVVIETVRLSGTITRGEIAHRTGLTQQSVSRIARSLLDRGILIEDAQLRATSGKPRTPVRLRGAAAHALGIHIDPELLTAVVIDLDGAIVCTRTRSVSADTDPAEFVERVAALGRETLAEAGGAVRPEGFLGIGVAVPGPVDIASGTVLGPPLMSAWGDLPLLYLLKDHFPCPVIMEKDSTAAAAGERWIGRDRRARDFAYLYLGTGVGTGLYLNGDIYRGVSSNAGEFGQLCAIALGRVDKDGRPEILPECNPPVSVPDLAARGGLRPAATTSGSTAAYLAVGRAAAAGDRAATAAVREVARAVGRGALGLIDLLDIDLIVLGGPFFTDDVADFYLAEIARTVNEFPTARRLRRVEVEPSVLSAGAAAVGAASTIFHATFTPRLRGRETRARHLPAG